MALFDVNEKIPLMEEGQTYRIHEGTCRICLNPIEWLLSIDDGILGDLRYKEIYKEFIGKPLKELKNHLPLICQTCEDELLQAFKFRKMCLEAEDVLNKLENSPFQIKVEQQDSVNETQDESVEEPRLNISATVTGKDSHVPDLMNTRNNQKESLQETTIDSILNIPVIEETSTAVQDKICRICCKHEDKLLSFYDKSYEDEPYTEIYQFIIGQCLKDYGNLHLWICELCENLMLQAFKFKKKCLQADEQLQRIEEENCKNDQLITDIKVENEEISFPVDVMMILEQQEEKNETTTNDQHDEQPTISTMDTETTYNPVNSCRICLKPKNNLRPFKDGIFEKLPYKEIYQECMRRPLKDYKNYPSLICQLCEGDLLQSFLFRKKCLEAEEKLTKLENKQDLNNRLKEIIEQSNLPTISSTKIDTNLQNYVLVEDDAEESQPQKKKAKIDDGNTDNQIRSLSPKKMPPLVYCLPKVLLVKLDQLPALVEPTSSKVIIQSPEPVKEILIDDETNDQMKKKCEKCSQYFTSLECLKNHMKIHEENLKYIKCKICAKNVPQCTFERHMYNHDNHKHNKHTADGKKTLTCVQCQKVFDTKWGVHDHIIKEHTVTKMQKCPICMKDVKESVLRRHIRHHEYKNRRITSSSLSGGRS